MGERTKIEWCDHTFNPWIGCTKVHEGCRYCYAEADQDHRRHRVRWGPAGSRSVTGLETWKQPFAWNRKAAAEGVRRRVFCASLADIFEDWPGPMCNHEGHHLVHTNLGFHPEDCEELESASRVTMADVRERLFKEVIDATPHLQWIVVTKRPQNIRRFWPSGSAESSHRRENVWLLTSVSDQKSADTQIPELLKCRDLCPVLGISAEPLLSPIDVSAYIHDLNWVIVGGESGAKARPMHPAWPSALRDQCQAANVRFFFKQWGEYVYIDHATAETAREFDAAVNVAAFGGAYGPWKVGKKRAGRLLDSREWNEFPGEDVISSEYAKASHQ